MHTGAEDEKRRRTRIPVSAAQSDMTAANAVAFQFDLRRAQPTNLR